MPKNTPKCGGLKWKLLSFMNIGTCKCRNNQNTAIGLAPESVVKPEIKCRVSSTLPRKLVPVKDRDSDAGLFKGYESSTLPARKGLYKSPSICSSISDDNAAQKRTEQDILRSRCRAALLLGDIHTVKDVFRQGFRPGTDRKGNTLLHLVARHGQIRSLRWLLKNTAISQASKNGRSETCAHLSATHGQLQCLKAILNNKRQNSDLQATTDIVIERESTGFTVLHLATCHGHLKTATYLIREYGERLALVKDIRGATALHLAAEQGYMECARILAFECPKSVYARDNTGETPLFYAAQCGHLPCLKVLHATAAGDLFSSNNQRVTLLHVTAERGHYDVIRFLIRSLGIDTYEALARQTAQGCTAFHLAAGNGYVGILELLLRHLTRRDVIHLTDVRGRTAAHYAAEGGYAYCLRLLVTAGLDLYSKDKSGDTPLSLSQQSGNEECIAFVDRQPARRGERTGDDVNHAASLAENELDLENADAAACGRETNVVTPSSEPSLENSQVTIKDTSLLYTIKVQQESDTMGTVSSTQPVSSATPEASEDLDTRDSTLKRTRMKKMKGLLRGEFILVKARKEGAADPHVAKLQGEKDILLSQNDYLYAQKYRPGPITLPIQRGDCSISAHSLAMDDDIDVEEIDRFHQSSEMFPVSDYATLTKTSMTGSLDDICEEDEEFDSASMFSYDNKSTTLPNTLDDDMVSVYNNQRSVFNVHAVMNNSTIIEISNIKDIGSSESSGVSIDTFDKTTPTDEMEMRADTLKGKMVSEQDSGLYSHSPSSDREDNERQSSFTFSVTSSNELEGNKTCTHHDSDVTLSSFNPDSASSSISGKKNDYNISPSAFANSDNASYNNALASGSSEQSVAYSSAEQSSNSLKGTSETGLNYFDGQMVSDGQSLSESPVTVESSPDQTPRSELTSVSSEECDIISTQSSQSPSSSSVTPKTKDLINLAENDSSFETVVSVSNIPDVLSILNMNSPEHKDSRHASVVVKENTQCSSVSLSVDHAECSHDCSASSTCKSHIQSTSAANSELVDNNSLRNKVRSHAYKDKGPIKSQTVLTPRMVKSKQRSSRNQEKNGKTMWSEKSEYVDDGTERNPPPTKPKPSGPLIARAHSHDSVLGGSRESRGQTHRSKKIAELQSVLMAQANPFSQVRPSRAPPARTTSPNRGSRSLSPSKRRMSLVASVGKDDSFPPLPDFVSAHHHHFDSLPPHSPYASSRRTSLAFPPSSYDKHVATGYATVGMDEWPPPPLVPDNDDPSPSPAPPPPPLKPPPALPASKTRSLDRRIESTPEYAYSMSPTQTRHFTSSVLPGYNSRDQPPTILFHNDPIRPTTGKPTDKASPRRKTIDGTSNGLSSNMSPMFNHIYADLFSTLDDDTLIRVADIRSMLCRSRDRSRNYSEDAIYSTPQKQGDRSGAVRHAFLTRDTTSTNHRRDWLSIAPLGRTRDIDSDMSSDDDDDDYAKVRDQSLDPDDYLVKYCSTNVCRERSDTVRDMSRQMEVLGII